MKFERYQNIKGYWQTVINNQVVIVYRRENERGELRWFARFAIATDDYGWGDTKEEAVRGLMV